MGPLRLTYQSETSVVRSEVRKWLTHDMNGLDLGAGGDPILPTAIALDLPHPYAATHDKLGRSHPHQLRGDARNLHWFCNGVLDYVYSSHLLEDFPNTITVLAEWIRVLKPGGKLILCLPDEKLYRAHCVLVGAPYNLNHQQLEMSRRWMEDVLRSSRMTIAHSQDFAPYSFVIVSVKP